MAIVSANEAGGKGLVGQGEAVGRGGGTGGDQGGGEGKGRGVGASSQVNVHEPRLLKLKVQYEPKRIVYYYNLTASRLPAILASTLDIASVSTEISSSYTILKRKKDDCWSSKSVLKALLWTICFDLASSGSISIYIN